MHAPVFTKVGDTYAIAPLTPLPDGMSWTSALGWDPVQLYLSCGVPLQSAYYMTESCRFGLGAMIPLPLPLDPQDPNRLVPHGAPLNTSVPMCFVPENQLLRFLFFHQIPMIQSSIIDDLVKKVEEVLALAAAGTEE